MHAIVDRARHPSAVGQLDGQRNGRQLVRIAGRIGESQRVDQGEPPQRLWRQIDDDPFPDVAAFADRYADEVAPAEADKLVGVLPSV